MTTYLYCLLAPPRPELLPPELRGIDGTPVRSLASGDLEAWVGTVSGAVAPDVARARAHNEVVDAAMATGRTPLPARFGQRFADDAACLADIEQRRAIVEAALRRVQGTVEMAILVTTDSPPGNAEPHAPARVDPHAPRAGHRYLAALRAREADEERWRERVLEQLHSVAGMVAALASASAPPEVGRGRVAGILTHLVPPEAVPAYRAAALRATLAPGFRVVVAGPRAPYSFCETATPHAARF